MKQLVLFLNLAMFFSVNLYCQNMDYSVFSDAQQFYSPVKHASAKHKIHNFAFKKHHGKSFLDLSDNNGYNNEALIIDSKDSACIAPVITASVMYAGFKHELNCLAHEFRQYSRDPGSQQRK